VVLRDFLVSDVYVINNSRTNVHRGIYFLLDFLYQMSVFSAVYCHVPVNAAGNRSFTFISFLISTSLPSTAGNLQHFAASKQQTIPLESTDVK